MSFVQKALIRLAARVLEGVLSQVAQQIDVIENQVKSELNRFIEDVVGGVWKGRGADAFVDELQGILIPKVDEITGNVSSMNTNVRSAADVIEQADRDVSGVVGELENIFQSVY